MRPRLLLSEDDDEMRDFLALALRAAGYDVTTCADGATLVDHLGSALAEAEEGFALVISDIRMAGLSGLEVLEGLAGWEGLPPVILITAFGDEKTHARARELGARTVLDKPFETTALLAAIRDAVGEER